MRKVYFILWFFFIELKLIKKRTKSILFFFKTFSISKLIQINIFKKKIYPFKDENLNKYLIENYFIWRKIKKNKKKIIIVDLTQNSHPLQVIIQCIISCNLKDFTSHECKAIINKYDWLSKFIAKSFLINKFIIVNRSNVFERFFYYLKSLNLIKEKNFQKKLLKFKYKKIELGRAAYEFTVRSYIKEIPTNRDNKFFYLALAKALQAYDESKKFFSDKNISSFVMSEIQFVPNRIYFQNALLKRIPIYSFYGARKNNSISICCFNNTKNINRHRMKFSTKLLRYLNKNHKINLKKKINKFIKLETTGYQIGFGEKIFLKILPKKKLLKFKNKKFFDKKFGLNNKLKNIMILPNVFIDNLLTHDKGLYSTPIEWFTETLKIISKIKNVNWIIKPHPSEKIYDTNITAKNLFNNTIGKRKNVIILDKDYNINNIEKYISKVISFGGSAGYEYTRLGVPVITAADTRYSNFKFTISPKNLVQYKKLLQSLNTKIVIDFNKKFRAGLYWYLIKRLAQLQNDLIPTYDTRKPGGLAAFWRLTYLITKKNKKNKTVKQFSKNFHNQLRNRNLHSLDMQELSKSKKLTNIKINDL